MGEPMYGELGLDALRAGLTASEALTALRSADPHPERRQVAMVDGHGTIGPLANRLVAALHSSTFAWTTTRPRWRSSTGSSRTTPATTAW